VEVTSFSNRQTDGNRIEVKWTSASENNNDFFTVEKSSDGVNYTELEKIKGAGNSNTLEEYTCYDAHPAIGKNYYKLKQTDYDGKSIYCKTATAEFIAEAFTVSNTVSGNALTVGITSDEEQYIFVSLINALGEIYYSQTVFVNAGINEVKIDLTENSSAFLFLQVSAGGKNMSKKIFIAQRRNQ
jgi:hypothetical protein